MTNNGTKYNADLYRALDIMKNYNAQTLPRLFLMDGNRKITLTRRGFHDGEEEKFKNDLSVEIERLLAELPPPKNAIN